MRFLISNFVTDTSNPIMVSEEGVYTIKEPKWEYHKDPVHIPSSMFDALCDIYDISPPVFPSDRFRKPYSFLLNQKVGSESRYSARVPWKRCMPIELWKEELKTYTNKLRDSFKDLDTSYFEKYFKRAVISYTHLKDSAIDFERFSEHLKRGEDNGSKRILKTFTPSYKDFKGNHFCNAPAYDHHTSITGRLRVDSGPQILHLKKEYRDIICSRWKGGSIYSVDYKALEPRVLLAIMKPEEHIPKDPYLSLLRRHSLNGKVDRDAVKIAINSIINGAGDEKIAGLLKGYIDYPDDFIRLVKDYFCIDELRKHLVEQHRKYGGRLIYNYYGRPIKCEGAPPYVLLNYYIQSTAVDVALLGFSNLVESLQKQVGYPVFVLHDALILDIQPGVDEQTIESYCNKAQTNIPLFEDFVFWLDLTRMR